MATYIGVDVGGTKIACGLVKVGEGKTPKVSSVSKVPTDALRGGEHVLATVIEQVKAAMDRADEAPLGVGISSAGVVNPKTGDITFANELMPGWGGTHLAAEVTAATGLPCRVLNDVHAHALGEARWGGGKGLPSPVLELAHLGPQQRPVILRPEGRLAVPSLPDADEDFVLALVQIGRDVLCHDERMPVEL